MQYNVTQSTILILSEVLWNDHFLAYLKFVVNLGGLDDFALVIDHISADVPEVNKCV